MASITIPYFEKPYFIPPKDKYRLSIEMNDLDYILSAVQESGSDLLMGQDVFHGLVSPTSLENLYRDIPVQNNNSCFIIVLNTPSIRMIFEKAKDIMPGIKIFEGDHEYYSIQASDDICQHQNINVLTFYDGSGMYSFDDIADVLFTILSDSSENEDEMISFYNNDIYFGEKLGFLLEPEFEYADFSNFK